MIISLTASAYELHVIVGLAIACIFGKHWFWPVALAAVGKEMFDFVDYGRPDFFDAFFTILGGIIKTRVYETIQAAKGQAHAAHPTQVVLAFLAKKGKRGHQVATCCMKEMRLQPLKHSTARTTASKSDGTGLT